MVEIVLWVAIGLLVLGMIGSVLPLVPSGLLSLAGVWIYALFGSEPIGPLALAVLTVTALAAAVLEQLGGPIAAKLSGSSNRVMVAATLGGVVLMFVLGPIGIIVGVVGVVFALELWEGTAADTAARRSLYTAAGILASSVVQLLLTFSILALFVLVVVIL